MAIVEAVQTICPFLISVHHVAVAASPVEHAVICKKNAKRHRILSDTFSPYFSRPEVGSRTQSHRPEVGSRTSPTGLSAFQLMDNGAPKRYRVNLTGKVCRHGQQQTPENVVFFTPDLPRNRAWKLTSVASIFRMAAPTAPKSCSCQ